MISSSIAKFATGIYQANQGKKALEKLDGKEPEIKVPGAIRQRVIQPVSESMIAAQQEGMQRRTGQAVRTLQTSGARGILGGLNSVLDAERENLRVQQARVDQERNKALDNLGRAELGVQRRRNARYLSKLNAARQLQGAGMENMMGGLESYDELGQQAISAAMGGGIPSGGGGQGGSTSFKTGNVPIETNPLRSNMNNIIKNG